MIESTKYALLLSIASTIIYASLIYFVRKEKKSLWAYGLCIFLSALAIWELYSFAKVEQNRSFELGSFSVFFEYVAVALPILATLFFLFRKHFEPRLKKLSTPNISGLDFSTKLRTATPYRLERLGIFFYKVLVWLFLGVVIGIFMAEMQGFMPIWIMIVHILGSVGLGWMFVSLFLLYTNHRKQSLTSIRDHKYGTSRAASARIDTIHSGGVRIMETRDLLIIAVTVFPEFEVPYRTTIRQFMMAEDIDRMHEGDIITFFEDTHDHGYGIVSPKLPTGKIPANFKTFKANKVYAERRKTGLWLLIGHNPNVFTRALSFVMIIAIFSIGFLSPYIVSGNVDWFLLRMKHFPQKIVFQNKGNFNAEEFKKAYDKAVEFVGDRRIQSLLFYKDFTEITIKEEDKSGYVRSTTIRGNYVEKNFMRWPIDERDRLFTSASLRYDVLKKVLDDLATENNLKHILYIGFRKDIRWRTRNHRIPPDYKKDYVDIHVVFNGGDKSLDYNGETGERFPK